MTRSSLAVCATVLVALALSPALTPPAVAKTPWGACGRSTAESKVVTRFYATPRAYYTLRCGTPAYGYRHILSRHRGDFERLAFRTGQNWRDIVELSAHAIARDPDKAKPRNDGKSCLSRVIFLKNLRTNQVVRQQIVRMIIRNSDNAIVSVYPDSRQCQ